MLIFKELLVKEKSVSINHVNIYALPIEMLKVYTKTYPVNNNNNNNNNNNSNNNNNNNP